MSDLDRMRVVPNLESVLDRAGVVRVRNVLNPLLWLTAVATPVMLLFAWLAGFDSFAGLVLLCLACLPVVTAVLAYAGFAFADPDRLQSEEFQLRQREIKLLEKGGTVIDIETIPLSEDPEALPPR